MSAPIDDVILKRISFLTEQISPRNRPAVNKMLQLQIDILRPTDLERLDNTVTWKKKAVKDCIDSPESERLFTELEALEWLQRQVSWIKDTA